MSPSSQGSCCPRELGRQLLFRRAHHGFDETEQLFFKARRPKTQRVITQPLHINPIARIFELLDRRGEAIDGLLLEPPASRSGFGPRNDGLRRAAAAIRDHGRAARLRLDGHDAEIFLAGKEQRLAAAQVVAQHLIGLPAEELNVLVCQRRSALVLPEPSTPVFA